MKHNLQIQTLSDSKISKDEINNNSYGENLNSFNIENIELLQNNKGSSDLASNTESENEINPSNKKEKTQNNINNSNSNNLIKRQGNITKTNVLQKNGEMFYSVKESKDNIKINHRNIINNINNCKSFSSSNNDEKSLDEDDEDDDDNDVDIISYDIYLKYKIIDYKKRIINFFGNKKGNNNNVIVKIPLSAYLHIIEKLIQKKDNTSPNTNDISHNPNTVIEINPEENKKINNTNNFGNEYVKIISIRTYQNFIKKIKDEVETNMNNKNSGDNEYMIDNNIFAYIQNFDKKIKKLKKHILYLLIKKHYIKSIKEKQKLILDNKSTIEKEKNDIYTYFQFLKNSINSMKNNEYNNQKKKEYYLMILDILKNYETINLRDVKIGKKLYKEGKINKYIINSDKIDKIYKNKIINYDSVKQNQNNEFDNHKAKIFMTLTVIVLPFVYIYNYFNTYKKNYSFIGTTINN